MLARPAAAFGASQPAETAKLLALAQACSARAHWLGVWRAACRPDNRFAMMAVLLERLQADWSQPAQLAAWGAAVGTLEDAERGCVAWQSLSVAADPLPNRHAVRLGGHILSRDLWAVPSLPPYQ